VPSEERSNLSFRLKRSEGSKTRKEQKHNFRKGGEKNDQHMHAENAQKKGGKLEAYFKGGKGGAVPLSFHVVVRIREKKRSRTTTLKSLAARQRKSASRRPGEIVCLKILTARVRVKGREEASDVVFAKKTKGLCR